MESRENDEAQVIFVGEFHAHRSGDSVFSGNCISLAVADQLLLDSTYLSLLRGHRYGLIGENGAGKTTLLRALSAQIEAEDATLDVQYVGQTDAERNAACAQTVTKYCASGDSRRAKLNRELERLESEETDDADEIAANAERIGELMLELEEAESQQEGAEEKADELLRRLGFTKRMRDGSVSKLSGGWRTRLEIAKALFSKPGILFLDEPTNHLDLHAVFQLASLLRNATDTTCIIVSHDAAFLDLVATDILSINGFQLQQISGNYAAFEEKAAEYRKFHEHKFENRKREEARQQESTNNQRANARRAGNDKAMKQAASRERKKQDRIGLYREDGKKFKLNSLKKMDVSCVRLPSRAEAVQKQRMVKLTLPKIHQQVKRSNNHPLIELQSVTIRYPPAPTSKTAATSSTPPAPRRPYLLGDVEVQVLAGDRVALVGANGAGKSTLLRALAGNAAPAKVIKGTVKTSGRIALVDQNQLALLEGHLERSSVEFLLLRHKDSSLMGGGPDGSGDSQEHVRKHLGGFGLGSDLALLPIAALSGGLRVRLVLADLFASDVPPDVLLLDEPTNHLDGETISALCGALKTFPGAVLAVSHNCAFLLEVCKDLWICETGEVRVQKQSETGEGRTFLDNFRAYVEKIVPESEKDALDDMLKVRAARAAIVVQQPGASTSLLV